MTVVADAGPLLALAKVGALALLTDQYRPVVTGPTVHAEAVAAGLAMGAGDAETLNEAYQRGELGVRTPTLDTLPRPGLLHAGEEESIRLAIELQAEWILIDDFDARQVAQENMTAAGVSTRIKGTLGVIVTFASSQRISSTQAIDIVQALKERPDIWLAPSLCDAVVETLRCLP